MIKNSIPKLVFLVGLPASGKSTIAKEYAENGYKAHSSDSIREELFGDINNQGDNEKVFKVLFERCRNDLKLGNNVVVDATNLVRKRRIYALKEITRGLEHVSKVALLVMCDYNDCIKRNKARDRKVPIDTMAKMYKSFQVPCKQEGFDRVVIDYRSVEYTENAIRNKIESLCKTHQNNPNHSLTIGIHCKRVAYDGLRDHINSDINLVQAARLHDVGKPFTMSFVNSKGELMDKAGYLQHENVGAYDAIVLLRPKPKYDHSRHLIDINILDIALLINTHMLPHNLKSEKSIEKHKNFFGEKFWDRLMLLHVADKNGR